MSGLILVKNTSSSFQNLNSAKAVFTKKSYSLNSREYFLGEFRLIFFEDVYCSTLKVFRSDQENFFCYCGFLIFKKKNWGRSFS
jgi:hypothetical protein